MLQQMPDAISWKPHISFACATLCSGLWAVLSPLTPMGASNVGSYLIGLILFVLVFFAIQHANPFSASCINRMTVSSKRYKTLCAVTMTIFFLAVFIAFVCASAISGGQAAMEWALNVFFVLTLASICGIALVLKFLKEKKGIRLSEKLLSCGWMICTGALLLFVAWWAYVPNSLNYLWDYEAYWFSAFAAVRGIPLTPAVTSYYGHYGMLMTPFFNLIGGFTPARMALLLSLEGVAVAAAFCYVLKSITTNFSWRFLGLFAMMGYFATLSTVEGQMTPHRVLFPVLLMAMAVFHLKHKTKCSRRRNQLCLFLGYALASIGLIWSTDSGFVGIAAWCALHFYLMFCEKSFSWRDVLHFLKIPLAGLLCIVAAWQATSIMNVVFWKGEAVSFDLFTAPFSISSFAVNQTDTEQPAAVPSEEMKSSVPAQSTAERPKAETETGYVGGLQLELERVWTPWGLVLVLFLLCMANGLKDMSFFTRKPQFIWQNGFGFFTAVLGLLMLIYFFNRAYYYNMFTAFFCILACCVLLGQQLKHYAQNPANKNTSCAAVYSSLSKCLLVCLILMICFAFGRLPIQVAKIRGCQQTAPMSIFFQELSARIPPQQAVKIVGTSATYYNAGLSRSNEEILWHPWVNETTHFSIPENTALLVTDEAYLDVLQDNEYFATILKEKYAPAFSFMLNYNNVGYEESKDFFVFMPND